MQYTLLPDTDIRISRIGLGAMRIAKKSETEVASLISSALDLGINFFDHADIYGGGHSEEVFASAWKRLHRNYDEIVLQSKCGIRPQHYDLSASYIQNACEGSLKRLNAERLDILLLHRPDALAQPEEIANAFDKLYTAGKVRFFGVSNHSPRQIDLLQKHTRHRIVVNQMQLSVTNASMIAAGINVNTSGDDAVNRDGGTLDYCRLNGIHVQAWSPMQFGAFQGAFVDNHQYETLNQTLSEIATSYSVNRSAIAIAWLLRHPANIQPILGTTDIQHLKDAANGIDIRLSRSEWYKIYLAAGYTLP